MRCGDNGGSTVCICMKLYRFHIVWHADNWLLNISVPLRQGPCIPCTLYLMLMQGYYIKCLVPLLMLALDHFCHDHECTALRCKGIICENYDILSLDSNKRNLCRNNSAVICSSYYNCSSYGSWIQIQKCMTNWTRAAAQSTFSCSLYFKWLLGMLISEQLYCSFAMFHP